MKRFKNTQTSLQSWHSQDRSRNDSSNRTLQRNDLSNLDASKLTNARVREAHKSGPSTKMACFAPGQGNIFQSKPMTSSTTHTQQKLALFSSSQSPGKQNLRVHWTAEVTNPLKSSHAINKSPLQLKRPLDMLQKNRTNSPVTRNPNVVYKNTLEGFGEIPRVNYTSKNEKRSLRITTSDG